MQVDQRSRVRQITFLVPSTEELTSRRRDWYTDRKTTELIWCWPEVNRKLPNSFKYTSNSLELSWIHFESFGITWNIWSLLEIFGIGLELFGILTRMTWNFHILQEISSNGCDFLWIWKTNFWIISNYTMFEENYWKSLEIFGTFWNQLGNFFIILKLVILVKIGIESNCTIVNFWNLGRIQWNIALDDM